MPGSMKPPGYLPETTTGHQAKRRGSSKEAVNDQTNAKASCPWGGAAKCPMRPDQSFRNDQRGVPGQGSTIVQISGEQTGPGLGK